MARMTAMPFDPGRLLLVTYPFTDQTAAKQRPVLVISGFDYNHGEDVIVVPLSSRVVPHDQFGIPIMETDQYFPQTRLRKSSSVKWTKPMVINQKVVSRKLGTIPLEVLKNVQEHVRKIFV